MDLSVYISKKVKIDLTNSYFYEGVVLNVDEDSLILRDRNTHLITISIKSISYIREVE